MSKAKKIISVICVLPVLFLSVFPTSSFATNDITWSIPMARPTVTDTSGYIELLFSHTDGSGYYGYTIAYDYVFVSEDSSSNTEWSHDMNVRATFKDGILTIYFIPPVSSSTFYVTVTNAFSNNQGVGSVSLSSFGVQNVASLGQPFGFPDFLELVGYHVYGFPGGFINSDTSAIFQDFTFLYNEDIVIYEKLVDIVNLLAELSANDETIITKLDKIVNSTDELETVLYDLLSLLSEVVDRLDLLVDDVAQIEHYTYFIYDFVRYIADNTDIMVSHLGGIEYYIQKIYESLQVSGDSEFTDPDTSNIDKYQGMEATLLDNSNVDVSNAVKVEIDQQALTIIWNMAEDFLNTHPQVFGLVITVLSISIIALILGRGRS